MQRTLKYYRILWLKHDFAAGLAVFLIALPFCLGIALASGAPLYSGLLSGMIGGIVVGSLSGASLAVSGPAAGLTTVVAASIISLGDYKIFLLAVMVAGLFQLLLGILKFGAIANYFPSSVIKGMLAGIGIILISNQIPLALGYTQPDFWSKGFVQIFSAEHFSANLEAFFQHFTKGAILIAVISIGILILMKKPFAKKLKKIPAPLIVVIIGILLNLFFTNLESDYSLRPTQLVNIPSNIFANISFPDFSMFFSTAEIWKDGIIIGLLATLETLLCIEAIDKLDNRNRVTPVNRELVAQGIGNMTCSLVGAIPMTAVIVRGSANVDAGGKTKLSAITHGLFLLLAVLLFAPLLNKIPYASLAAILIMTGFNLTKPKLIVSMWKLGWNQFIPFLVTIAVILSTDLLMGVSVGLLVSIFFIIRHNFKTEYKMTSSKQGGIVTQIIKLDSNVTFLNKVKLRKVLNDVPEYTVLIIDGTECKFIDYDVLEIISEYQNKAHDKHIELQLKGIEKVKVMAGH